LVLVIWFLVLVQAPGLYNIYHRVLLEVFNFNLGYFVRV